MPYPLSVRNENNTAWVPVMMEEDCTHNTNEDFRCMTVCECVLQRASPPPAPPSPPFSSPFRPYSVQIHHYYRNFDALKDYVCGELDFCPMNKAREAHTAYPRRTRPACMPTDAPLA